MRAELSDWCEANNLPLNELVEDRVYELERGDEFSSFLLLHELEGKIIGRDMALLLDKEAKAYLSEFDIDYVLYEFGGRFYYTPTADYKEKKSIQAKFNDFKYLVTAPDEDFCHLGVHGEYELLNGSHSAEDWAKKAKSLGHKNLGICDHNTLAGVLGFQLACDKYGLKPILGATISIEHGDNNIHRGKVYALNTKGWRNLLRINKAINVDNGGKFIKESELINYGEGVAFVFDTDNYINSLEKVSEMSLKIALFKRSFDLAFYQIDTVEYDNDDQDMKHLRRVQKYFRELSGLIEPILINDSYYLDKEEKMVKHYLNQVAGIANAGSDDLYYKDLSQSLAKFDGMFIEDSHVDLLLLAVQNTLLLAEKCNFKIPVGMHKLPKYEPVTIFEVGGDQGKFTRRRKLFEKEHGVVLDKEDTNEQLFYNLLQKGVDEKLGHLSAEEFALYEERLTTEIGVIVPAGFIDYFLILWDMIAWAKFTANILVGNARGSVAGSLVAYLLDITTVDPIKYNLLFERFLNKTRVSGERAKAADALPDIDVDFEGLRREDVKQYLRDKYGREYVASIGTYNRAKLKSAMKDLGRVEKINFQHMNRVTKMIDDQLKYEWEDLFRYAQENKELKKWVHENPDLVNNIKFVLNQAKSASIHASALIIVPKQDEDGNPMTIYDWLPVKVIDGHLVTEWEGKYIDRAGYLKEDILGLYQLDKFHMMLDLIEKETEERVVLEDIEFEEPQVFQYFADSRNEDIFQFGSPTFRKYLTYMQPSNLEDLIAANALIRPGPMSSDAHTDFARMKKGLQEPEYDYGMEEITKNTQGLMIYQEQIMQAMTVAGLSLVEADEVRTVMKKFDRTKMLTFQQKFVDGYTKFLMKNKE